jgi:hypothetical protein
MPFCPKCGKEVRPEDSFCRSCGSQVGSTRAGVTVLPVDRPRLKPSIIPKVLWVIVGLVALGAGIILYVVASSALSTVSACSVSFWCNLGSILTGTNLGSSYERDLFVETGGIILSVFGLAMISLGFIIKWETIASAGFGIGTEPPHELEVDTSAFSGALKAYLDNVEVHSETWWSGRSRSVKVRLPGPLRHEVELRLKRSLLWSKYEYDLLLDGQIQREGNLERIKV